MKRFQILTAAFCAAVLLCGLSTTAYAGGGEEWEGLDPAEPAATEEPAEPTVTPGEGFSEEGNLVTRDLLYDEHTNKQFITVQARGGATFYLVIDYDKPVDEEGEQYETYFLNMVDEADLPRQRGRRRRSAPALRNVRRGPSIPTARFVL